MKNISIGLICGIFIFKIKNFFKNEGLLCSSGFLQEYIYIIDYLKKNINLNNKKIIYQIINIVKDNAIYQEKTIIYI